MKSIDQANALAPPFSRHLRATPRSGVDTAQPPLTSGFGSVMDHERGIQDSTEACLRLEDPAGTSSLHQVLHEQSARLSGNLALLEQRYAILPSPARFRSFHGRLTPAGPPPADRSDPLLSLIAQHRRLLLDIVALIARRADGQRGELILAEVARSHTEMLESLAGFAASDMAHDPRSAPVMADAATPISPGEGAWENEGGAAPAGSPGVSGKSNGGT